MEVKYMKNPLRRIREEEEITINDMALKLGVNYMTYFRAEKGMNLTISPIIMNGFEKMGYDKEKIEKEYREWRNSKMEK